MQNKSYLIFEPSNKIHGKWGPNPLLYKMVKRRKLLSFKPLFINVWGDGSWHKCKIFSSKIMSASPKIGTWGVSRPSTYFSKVKAIETKQRPRRVIRESDGWLSRYKYHRYLKLLTCWEGIVDLRFLSRLQLNFEYLCIYRSVL